MDVVKIIIIGRQHKYNITHYANYMLILYVLYSSKLLMTNPKLTVLLISLLRLLQALKQNCLPTNYLYNILTSSHNYTITKYSRQQILRTRRTSNA